MTPEQKAQIEKEVSEYICSLPEDRWLSKPNSINFAKLSALREELEKVKSENYGLKRKIEAEEFNYRNSDEWRKWQKGIEGGLSKSIDSLAEQLSTARAELAEARKEIEELKDQNRWIPISERLPDSFAEVWTFNGRAESGWHDIDGWFSEYRDGEIIEGVSHWRPLPLAPESK